MRWLVLALILSWSPAARAHWIQDPRPLFHLAQVHEVIAAIRIEKAPRWRARHGGRELAAPCRVVRVFHGELREKTIELVQESRHFTEYEAGSVIVAAFSRRKEGPPGVFVSDQIGMERLDYQPRDGPAIAAHVKSAAGLAGKTDQYSRGLGVVLKAMGRGPESLREDAARELLRSFALYKPHFKEADWKALLRLAAREDMPYRARVTAFSLLAGSGRPDWEAAARHAARKSRDINVRAACLRLIAGAGGPDAGPFAAGFLTGVPPLLQAEAVAAVTGLKYGEALPALEKLLNSVQDEQILYGIVTGVARMGLKSSHEAIHRWAREHPNARVRSLADRYKGLSSPPR
ncbi:MAG: hypothetical protein GMKNLPBB_03143 [Myxococcota bacterium]|nr:hypothetical protein [Myxococcota bacterium]